VEAVIYSGDGKQLRSFPLQREKDGYFIGTDPLGQAGDRYKLRPDGGMDFPSPASHYQPEGVHGPSMVVDHRRYQWGDSEWRKPAFRDLIIYELHIGTFTGEGTFLAAAARMPYVRDLGINAIEIMPLADFPGERGWGYDGVHLFAPARCYGKPDDLRSLVDAAHASGIAVILDVVYNHFGPDGNYVTQFSPYYFEHEDKTPWGDAVNFGREHSAPVRDFYKSNLTYWMECFHMDGFRLDATHAIPDGSDRHILTEFAELAESHGAYMIAEDERNDARLVTPISEDGFGLTAAWADDFHHTLEVAVTDASRYREDFTGELRELIDAMHHGWVYRGQESRHTGAARGTECQHVPPERFIFCISNHDQVGNRAFGERVNQLVSPATYRAVSALLLLSPYTPMLFQGQEWAPTTPFLYFTDHNAELGRLVEEGRQRECRFAVFAAGASQVPSPQAEGTFNASKLKWAEIEEPTHEQTLALYRELIRLRRTHQAFRPTERNAFDVSKISAGVLGLRLRGQAEEWLLICDLQGGHSGSLSIDEATSGTRQIRWTPVLSTNDKRFGGDGTHSFDPQSGRFAFRGPEALLLRALS
jgi:maltooligosyltrehalose trehalohydrolase